MGHQSRLTPALKALFEYVLTDPAYVERLKRHYAAFKADIKRRPLRGGTRGTLGATPGRERITRAQAKHLAFQFRVTLQDITPPIWRLIEVPATYTFWDLHTAIQDAMGWTDSHLHAFEIASAIDDSTLRVGSPNDDGFLDDEPTVAGWDLPLTDFFALPGAVVSYEYDFGDDWQHDVLLEAVVPLRAIRKRPRCLAGERACPPEDCGGSYGYQELVAAMAKPHSAAYREYIEWLGQPYDAEHFDPTSVRFHDPKRRRRMAYGF